jgi:ABC-type molybdate transport system substrate-binding protein
LKFNAKTQRRKDAKVPRVFASLRLCVKQLVIASALLLSAGSVEADLVIAAASDLRFALDDVVAEFGKAHPDIQPKPIYGSSGNFYAQIMNDAPFDLFLSADAAYPRQLIAAGKAKEEDLSCMPWGVSWFGCPKPRQSKLNKSA